MHCTFLKKTTVFQDVSHLIDQTLNRLLTHVGGSRSFPSDISVSLIRVVTSVILVLNAAPLVRLFDTWQTNFVAHFMLQHIYLITA